MTLAWESCFAQTPPYIPSELLEAQPSGCRILTFVSQGRGAGLTTLAHNVAATLAHNPRNRVLYLAWEPLTHAQLGSQTSMAEEGLAQLAHLYKTQGGLTGSDLAAQVARPAEHLHLLAMPPNAAFFEGWPGHDIVSPIFVSDLLSAAKSLYTHIVCDVGLVFEHLSKLTLHTQSAVVVFMLDLQGLSAYIQHDDVRAVQDAKLALFKWDGWLARTDASRSKASCIVIRLPTLHKLGLHKRLQVSLTSGLNWSAQLPQTLRQNELDEIHLDALKHDQAWAWFTETILGSPSITERSRIFIMPSLTLRPNQGGISDTPLIVGNQALVSDDHGLILAKFLADIAHQVGV